MQAFRVEAVPGDSACTLILTGEPDLSAAPDITELSGIALNDPIIQTLIINLAAMMFVDSTTIGALNPAAQSRRRKRQGARPSHVPERVEEVLAISGLTEVFEVLDEG